MMDQICDRIREGLWTEADLHKLQAALKEARDNVIRQNSRKVRVGSTVYFTDTRKYGPATRQSGTVRHVNRKTVTLAPSATYPNGVRVPLSMVSFTKEN